MGHRVALTALATVTIFSVVGCGGSSKGAVITRTTSISTSYQQVFVKVGHTRTFDYLHRGDQIICLAGKHSVEANVPSRRTAAFKQQTVSPTRRLALNVGWRHGRVWTLCRWR